MPVGNDAGVVGEGAVDQFGGKHDVAELKARLGGRNLDRHVLRHVLQKLLHFAHRLARSDNAGHADRPFRRRRLDPRQPMAVGRDRAQHRFAVDVHGVEENAVEIVPRLLGRDRELGVLDQALELDRGEREAVRELSRGEIGEVGRRQGLKGEARSAGAQDQLPGVAGGFEARLCALRQLADDVVDHVGRNGGRAVLGDIGGNGLGSLEVEVGALQRQSAIPCLKQHIGEDRDGVSPLDDAMDVPKRFKQD